MTRTNLLWKVQDVSVQRWLLGRDFWRNWCLLESIACQLHLRHKIDALFQRILTSNSQCCFLCCPFLWDYDGLCRVPKLGTAVSRTSFSGIKRHKDPSESETSQIAPFLPDEYQILSMPGPRRNPNNPSAAQNPARPWIAVPGQGQYFRHLLVGYMGWGWEVARHLGTNLDRFLPANKSGRRRQMYILYAWIPCSSHVHSFTYECFSSLHITNNFSLMVMVSRPPCLPLLPGLPCWRCCLWVHGHELVVVGHFGLRLLLSPGIRSPGLSPNAVDVRGLILRISCAIATMAWSLAH